MATAWGAGAAVQRDQIPRESDVTIATITRPVTIRVLGWRLTY